MTPTLESGSRTGYHGQKNTPSCEATITTFSAGWETATVIDVNKEDLVALSHLALGVVLGVPGQGHPLSQHVLHSHHTRGVGVQVGTASPCAAGAGGGRRAWQGAHLGDIARKQRRNH